MDHLELLYKPAAIFAGRSSGRLNGRLVEPACLNIKLNVGRLWISANIGSAAKRRPLVQRAVKCNLKVAQFF